VIEALLAGVVRGQCYTLLVALRTLHGPPRLLLLWCRRDGPSDLARRARPTSPPSTCL